MIENQNILLGVTFLVMLYFFWKGIRLFRGKEMDSTLGRLGKNVDATHPINKKIGQSFVLQGFGIFAMGMSLLVNLMTALETPEATVNASAGRPYLWIGLAIFIAGMILRGISLRNAIRLPDPKKKRNRKKKKRK